MSYDNDVDKMSTKKGGKKVTDTKRLLEIIEASGLKKKYIAHELGLTPYGLQKKIENKNQFKAIEIKMLCDLLKITSLKTKDEIFFASDVDKTPIKETK